LPSEMYLTEISPWRQKLFELEPIGEYKDSGIGYDNNKYRTSEALWPIYHRYTNRRIG